MMSKRLVNIFLIVRLISLLTICLARQSRASHGRDESSLETRAIIELSLGDAGGTSEIETLPQVLKSSESLSQKIIGLLHGIYVNFKPAENITGFLKLIPEQAKSEDFTGLGGDVPDGENWVGVIICSDSVSEDDLTGTATTSTDKLIERMKNAMLLGASAFIILAMNRNALREVQDISSAVTKVPVALIDNLHNITKLLSVLASKLKFRVSMTSYAVGSDVQTYTIWSTCWRAQPGGGVICMSDHKDSKTSPSLVWSYFYSALAVLMLLLLIKAEPRHIHDDDENQSQLLGNIVRQALADMKIRRYRRSMATVRNYDDSERDTCAICLETFNFRQKIRVLPCLHEFHCKCIDPWLLKHSTCPLCKYKVIS